jgi:hypothetical protein
MPTVEIRFGLRLLVLGGRVGLDELRSCECFADVGVLWEVDGLI